MTSIDDPALDAILAAAWQALGAAVADRASPMRTPALATVGCDGRPAVRTVVLRGVDPARRRLVVHTDARSVKTTELAARPHVALLAYDPGAALQLRIEGEATLRHRDDVTRTAWASLAPASRAAYRTDPAPGQPVAHWSRVSLVPEAAAADRLMVVEIALAALDWLHLSMPRHRRARFRWHGSRLDAAWLAP